MVNGFIGESNVAKIKKEEKEEREEEEEEGQLRRAQVQSKGWQGSSADLNAVLFKRTAIHIRWLIAAPAPGHLDHLQPPQHLHLCTVKTSGDSMLLTSQIKILFSREAFLS